MKKDRKWFLSIMFGVLVVACTTDAYETNKKVKDKDKPLSETWHADPENYHCLNVVYYVPADVDTLNLWHKRLSGLTLNTQKFFKENMQRNRFDKTFGLVVNDSNQNYITISYIKSKREAAKMQVTDVKEMAVEVMDYFAANPSEKRSNHFLVYMPKYSGSFFNTIPLNPSNLEMPDHMMAFCGCDAESFDPKFLTSRKGRETHLQDLGQVMYELMHAFFQSDNNGVLTSSRFSLTGHITTSASKKYVPNYKRYWEDLQLIDLTPTDAMWLNQIQVFNEEGTHEYNSMEEVTIKEVKYSWLDEENHIVERDSLLIECTFESSDEIVGAIAYIDPWQSSTVIAEHEDANMRNEGDALASCVFVENFDKAGNGLYKVSFLFLWSDMNTGNIRNNYTESSFPSSINDPAGVEGLKLTNRCCRGEVRFRFIAKGGMAYPQPLVSEKGEWNPELKLRNFFLMRQYWFGQSYQLGGLEYYPADIVERYSEIVE